jgi:AbiV family abortive infection protein
MAKTLKTTPLPSGELARLARATLDNAVDLLSDARLLYEAERWQRAYALGVLAAEEYGKFYACVAALGYETDDAESWTKFWDLFRYHDPKFTHWAGQYINMWGWAGPDGHSRWMQAWEHRAQVAKAIGALKMASLYVDYVDETVCTPRGSVNQATAQILIAEVSRVIDQAAADFAGDLSRLATVAPIIMDLYAKIQAGLTEEEEEAAVHEAYNRLMQASTEDTP